MPNLLYQDDSCCVCLLSLVSGQRMEIQVTKGTESDWQTDTRWACFMLPVEAFATGIKVINQHAFKGSQYKLQVSKINWMLWLPFELPSFPHLFTARGMVERKPGSKAALCHCKARQTRFHIGTCLLQDLPHYYLLSNDTPHLNLSNVYSIYW